MGGMDETTHVHEHDLDGWMAMVGEMGKNKTDIVLI